MFRSSVVYYDFLFPYTHVCMCIDSVRPCPLSVAKVNWEVWSILVSVCAQPRSSSATSAAEEKHSRANERALNEGKREDERTAGWAGSRGRWALIESFGPCFVRSQGLLQESGFMLFLTMGFRRKGICTPVGFLCCDSLPYTPLISVIPAFLIPL